ncbi:LysR family transcriptional regulator [Bordetella genomosp. 13]|uniref:LysR family transcriptional regulator n=1 Tax=Bordetella genomosp. 13 TaxID=463040 RepID=UPI0011A3FC36|nr:LysR family transcriptional regulator [Bordetella genomosp. 13]
MITFKQLEAFYWSVELEGFEPAAMRLNTTQSAISKRLQELEGILGFPLFDRTRRKAQVTPRGEKLRLLAREALEVRTRILDMSRADFVEPRTVRIGVTELTAMTWLPGLVQRVHGSYPTISLEPSVGSSVSLAAKLMAGELDLVVAPDAFRDAGLAVLPLEAVEYAWICSPAYLDDDEQLPLKTLAGYTIIEQRHESGLGALVDQWLDAQQVRFTHTLSSSSLTASASLTLAGLGICYLPRRLFEQDLQAGHLRIIRSKPSMPHIPYAVLYAKAHADDLLRYVATMATEECDFSRPMPAYFSGR